MGYGSHLMDVPFENIVPLIKIRTATGFISFMGCDASKTSFALTLLRLSEGWYRRSIYVIIVLLNLDLLAVAMLTILTCIPIDGLWDFSIHAKCLNFLSVLRTVAAGTSKYISLT
jgi:hypothetical protein